MKKILLALGLLVWGGCQTSPLNLVYQPVFESFKIQKLTQAGVETVELKPSTGDWPEAYFTPAQKINFNSKNLKMAVIGDTGCRLKEALYKNSYQNCNNTKEWPYAQIIETLVKENFDFAIHTGDYHYREQCTDRKLCPAYTKSVGYHWSSWWDDFYGPTQSLFKKSPVLLIRGNHEDCKRAYSGWNPLSPLNKKFNEACVAVEPYQWIEMGDLVLINFDDSAFEDRKKTAPEEQQNFLDILKEISNRIDKLKGKKEIWFLAHKPVYAYVPNRLKPSEQEAVTPNLQKSMQAAGLLAKVDYILSGHIHNQQLVVDRNSLMQIIVGHSGSALDPFGQKIKNDQMISTTATPYHFGYAIFERQGFKKWKMNFKNLQGETDLSCDVNKRQVNCT